MNKTYVIIPISIIILLVLDTYYFVPIEVDLEKKAKQTCGEAGYDRYTFQWGVQLHTINGTKFVECGNSDKHNVVLVPFNNTVEKMNRG